MFGPQFLKVADSFIFPQITKTTLHSFSLHHHFYGPMLPGKVRTTFSTKNH